LAKHQSKDFENKLEVQYFREHLGLGAARGGVTDSDKGDAM
jgi:hypothetical protein